MNSRECLVIYFRIVLHVPLYTLILHKIYVVFTNKYINPLNPKCALFEIVPVVHELRKQTIPIV